MRLFALLAALIFVAPQVVVAQTATFSIEGRVADASTSLPIAGVTVETVGPTDKTVHTDSFGRFNVSGLTPGEYQLRLNVSGYQATLSDAIYAVNGGAAQVTLAMSRQQSGAETLRTIARTTTRASESLQRSAVIYKQASIESIQSQGFFRTGDFLRTLPQINLSAATGGSDTPSPGDDQYLDVRGIGGLETVALIDGHPIGFGINRGKNLGYNWEVSPTFGLRSVQVVYGSGVAGLTPYSAVGGTINMQTLEPTKESETSLTEGYGTFDKFVTVLTSTGTIQNRLGYAFAYGTQGIDGPYKSAYFFQPSAAFDPSAPVNTTEYQSGIYKDDTAVSNRGFLGKLSYRFNDKERSPQLTLSAITAGYWDDKTGNGDQDFLPYNTALALGNSSLAAYAPGNSYTLTGTGGTVTTSCPAGQFTPTNANGNPWGYGINGNPDGGKSCVTPQQYAQIASGLQGAGTTWQSFNIGDYTAKLDMPVGNTDAELNVYTNRFNQIYDRTYTEPFLAASGDSPFWLQPQVTTSGGSLTDQYFGNQNDIGLGYAYNNYAYFFKQNGTQQPSPIVHDTTVYAQDVYHPTRANYTAYVNVADTHSTTTNTTNFNPRVALVFQLPDNNVLRVASGATTVQPYATYLDLPYAPIAPAALNGNLNCTGLTTVGQVSNPGLLPEKAVDEELSIGHRFGGDSIMQVEVYNENVNNKIYSTIIPVSGLPGGTIPGAQLNTFETAINSACGTNGLVGVGVNSQANVGRLLAQGADLSGRARVNRHLFFDYDYSIESTSLRSADVTTLQNNLTLILDSQLPGVPLHKADAAIDYTFDSGLNVRLQQYWVAVNNAKNSPAYNYGVLTGAIPVGKNGRFNVSVMNVFNQFNQYEGLIGEGVPLPLNQYATAANYAPLVGTSATELYGIPPRQIYFGYTIKVK